MPPQQKVQLVNETKRSFSSPSYKAPLKWWVAVDRDGTIIQERHYLSDPDNVELIPGAAEGLRQLNKEGINIVVITNQSGSGRGYFDEPRLDQIHQRLTQLLETEAVHLKGIYFCPHTPEDDCLCRKPGIALLESAAMEMGLAPEACVVIGDKASDIQMGQRAGATTVLVRTGYGAEVEKSGIASPDHVANGLLEAAGIVQRLIGHQEPDR